ncbi:MAG: hypothetical protein U0359_07890 [Byssovorax sp.]
MSAAARVTALLGLLAAGPCTAQGSGAKGQPAESATVNRAQASSAQAALSAAMSAHVASSASAPAVTPPSPADPTAAWLSSACVVALAPRRIEAGRMEGPGLFRATLEGPGGQGGPPVRRAALLSIDLDAAPAAHRRPLAFARMAEALGVDIVPRMVERHLGAGDLAALLGGLPLVKPKVLPHLSIQNDGTLTALLAAPFPGAAGDPWAEPALTALHPKSAALVARWESWAASPAPAQGERPRLARAVVEMLVLDYLAANGTRRALLFSPELDAVVLEDNRDAFPPNVERPLLDPLLRKLRAVARFPCGLREALARFDRARAEAVLNPGSFEGWLLSPRSLIELDERRAGLLSLIEAQIALRGEEAVLSL